MRTNFFLRVLNLPKEELPIFQTATILLSILISVGSS